MSNKLVTIPYQHDVQSGGTPMVPSSTNANLGVVPVANADGTPISGSSGGALSNNNAAPSNNNTGVLPAVANAAAPSLTEGNQALLSEDLSGNTRITLGTKIAGENTTTDRLNVEPVYSYARITTATTLLVKTGAGTLHAIIVNTPVASGTIEIDDAVTNTTPIIGKITYPATLLSSGADAVIYDVSFATGLSITTTGTMDITIAYR